MSRFSLSKIRKSASRRKLRKWRRRELWRRWRIRLFKTRPIVMNRTRTSLSKYKKCIIINQEALSLLGKYRRTTKKKFQRSKRRSSRRKPSRPTISTRISTYLRRKKNSMMIPPILEEARAMALNSILLRFQVVHVFLMVNLLHLQKKRLRGQNHIWTRRLSQ